MPGRLRQKVRRRQLGVFRVVESRLPVIVPDAKHRAEGDVDLAVRLFVEVFGKQKQFDDAPVDDDGTGAGVIVDRLDVVNALVIVVDVVKLMIGLQPGAHLFG